MMDSPSCVSMSLPLLTAEINFAEGCPSVSSFLGYKDLVLSATDLNLSNIL